MTAPAPRPARLLAVFLGAAVPILASSAVSAQRADSAAFIIRLGADTTAVERYVRTGDRLDAVSVSRSPRTTVRRLTVWFAPDGSVTRFAAGGAQGQLTEQAPAVAGAIPLVGGFYVPWEIALQQAHRSGGQSARVNMLAGAQAMPVAMRRAGADTWSFNNQFDQPVQATVDAQGRMLSFAIQGGGATAERVRWVDIDALATAFSARDQGGRGMGSLSPRDSTSATVAGARITVDYGRPSLRGRDLAVLVPAGQVWRMGANDATRLSTDQAIRVGDIDLAPGEYSLFAIPGDAGWTLIINSQTGMSGLNRDPDRDVGRVQMTVRQLEQHVEQFTIVVEPRDGTGTLSLRWGRLEASAPIRTGG